MPYSKNSYVQGCTPPPVKGAGYSVERHEAPKMPGPVTSDGQARSPKPATIGGTRGVAAGGAKVAQGVNTSSHDRAWGLKG